MRELPPVPHRGEAYCLTSWRRRQGFPGVENRHPGVAQALAGKELAEDCRVGLQVPAQLLPDAPADAARPVSMDDFKAPVKAAAHAVIVEADKLPQRLRNRVGVKIDGSALAHRLNQLYRLFPIP